MTNDRFAELVVNIRKLRAERKKIAADLQKHGLVLSSAASCAPTAAYRTQRGFMSALRVFAGAIN